MKAKAESRITSGFLTLSHKRAQIVRRFSEAISFEPYCSRRIVASLPSRPSGLLFNCWSAAAELVCAISTNF